MAKTNVQIDLDRPAGPYYPGDPVQATITLQNEKDLTVRGVTAWLVLREEYKYVRRSAKGHVNRYTETQELRYDQADLVEEGVIPAGTHTYPVSLRLPDDAVPPYSGKITKNNWLVKVKVDCPKAFDPEAEAAVLLIVPPPGRNVAPAEVGEAQRCDEAELRLWLPRLEWVEGETIEGKLLVQPRDNFSVSEVRLELTRTEYVPRASGDTESHAEGKVKLADKVEFWPAHPVEYPFALTVPRQGMPTRSTQFSAVTWSLTATLARRLRKDSEISAEIEVYNGPAPT
jgi:hypothetical protein